MSDDIKNLNKKTSLSLIPKYYEGVHEMTRIQQANDALIRPLIEQIQRLFRNGYFSTMDVDSLSEYEKGLGIEPAATLTERRQAVIDMINDHITLNDETLLRLIQALEGCEDVTFDVDTNAFTLNLHHAEDHDSGQETETLQRVIEYISKIVPLNLLLFRSTKTSLSKTVVINHASLNTVWFNLGLIEYIEPEPTEPIVKFLVAHPSLTPYSAAEFSFTSTSGVPILWQVGARNAYLKADYPNGIVFGIRQNYGSTKFGPDSADLYIDYDIDSYLRCRTAGELYTNIDDVTMAYITGDASVESVDVYRLEDGAKFKAYYSAEFEKYFVLDDSYASNRWVDEQGLEESGYSNEMPIEEIEAFLSPTKAVVSISAPRIAVRSTYDQAWAEGELNYYLYGDTQSSYQYPLYDSDGNAIKFDVNKRYILKSIKYAPDGQAFVPNKTSRGITYMAGAALAVAYAFVNVNRVLYLRSFTASESAYPNPLIGDRYSVKLEVVDRNLEFSNVIRHPMATSLYQFAVQPIDGAPLLRSTSNAAKWEIQALTDSIIGFRIRELPQFYFVRYGVYTTTVSHCEFLAYISTSTTTNHLFILRDVGGGKALGGWESALPLGNLHVFDIAGAGSGMNFYRFGTDSSGQPLRVYSSITRDSTLLYETNNTSQFLYASELQTIGGSKWGRVTLKQKDKVINGYVEAGYSMQYALSIYGPRQMLTNYIPDYYKDTASGTISALQLPSAHAGNYKRVTFDSLRYYAKGVIHDIEKSQSYAATLTWTDTSLGDLTDKVTISKDAFNVNNQTVFRIIFIYSTNIAGSSARDATSNSFTSGYISSYTYENGVHSIRFHYTISDWTNSSYTGRIMIRYLDGVTKFPNLDAFDLIDVSDGSLTLNTSSDRYDMYSVWGGEIDLHAEY